MSCGGRILIFGFSTFFIYRLLTSEWSHRTAAAPSKKIKIKNLPKSGITKPKPQISEISEIPEIDFFEISTFFESIYR